MCLGNGPACQHTLASSQRRFATKHSEVMEKNRQVVHWYDPSLRPADLVAEMVLLSPAFSDNILYRVNQWFVIVSCSSPCFCGKIKIEV